MRPGKSPSHMDRSPKMLWEYFLTATFFVWSFVGMCFPMADTDFWWHLKTGEWILAGNGIPHVDLYTFTDFDKSWIDLHWGFQLLITVLYRIGGVPLVTVVKSAVYTTAIGFGWYASGRTLPAWKKVALWLLPVVCIAGRANERPEMLSQLFLAVWLWYATQSDRRPRLIWSLPLVQLVWVNCHALFALGLVVGFCYVVDASVRHRMGGKLGLEPRVLGPSLATIYSVGGLVVLVCFLNPYFEQGALFPLTLYRKFSVEKEFYSKNIGEFQPPIEFVLRYGLTNIYLIAEFGAWLIATVSFFWLLAKRQRWSLFRLVLFAGFSHLAWQASRNTNIFALVAGFVASENFSDAQRSDSESTDTRVASAALIPTQFAMVLIVSLNMAVVSGLWNEFTEKNKPFRLGELPNWFIHDAARFAGQAGFPERAFVANIGQADVYVYHNGPRRKVFMDARLEVCTQQTFESFNNILNAMANGSSSWESLFRDDGLPVVILDSRMTRPSINGMLNNPKWRLVFADQSAAVFLPVELADKLQLPNVNPAPLAHPDGPPIRMR